MWSEQNENSPARRRGCSFRTLATWSLWHPLLLHVHVVAEELLVRPLPVARRRVDAGVVRARRVEVAELAAVRRTGSGAAAGAGSSWAGAVSSADMQATAEPLC